MKLWPWSKKPTEKVEVKPVDRIVSRIGTKVSIEEEFERKLTPDEIVIIKKWQKHKLIKALQKELGL